MLGHFQGGYWGDFIRHLFSSLVLVALVGDYWGDSGVFHVALVLGHTFLGTFLGGIFSWVFFIREGGGYLKGGGFFLTLSA